MRIITLNYEKTGAVLTGYVHSLSCEMPAMAVRPVVLVFPGGGYEFVSDRENEPVAMQFFAQGYQVFVLKYSVMEKAKDMNPLEEAAWAMLTIREHAKEWQLDPQKIAVCGFSAGGHLAGSIGILYKKKELLERLQVSAEQIKPNAMILSYPVICAGEYAHQGSFEMLIGKAYDDAAAKEYSLEQYVDGDTPPAFIWHAVDDCCVPVENSLMLMAELQKNKVPYEGHLFETGNHGISMCNKEVGSNLPHCAHWFKLCIEWLEGRKLGLE